MPDTQHQGGAKIVPPIPVPGRDDPLRFVTPARDWLIERMVQARASPDATAMQTASGLYNALAPYGEQPQAEIPPDLHQRLSDFAVTAAAPAQRD